MLPTPADSCSRVPFQASRPKSKAEGSTCKNYACQGIDGPGWRGTVVGDARGRNRDVPTQSPKEIQ